MNEKKSIIIRQAVASGILIGIGVVINLSLDNKYVGAMLFSVGLLAIIKNGIPLYTGRIGYIRKYKIVDLLLMLIFNLVGVVFPVLMVGVCKDGFFDRIVEVSNSKFSNGFLQLFFLGMLCGVLMFVAVHTKFSIITVFCIMIFILSGYEHCVADFPFLILNPSIMNVVKFLCIVLGNSVGSIVTYELMVKEKASWKEKYKKADA